jgi:flagellar biogenesis protein FliO
MMYTRKEVHRPSLLSRTWAWIQSQSKMRSPSKRMHLIETLSLGDKRFIAVIEVDKLQFLIASSPTAITLLATIPPPETFSDILTQTNTAINDHAIPRARTAVTQIRADA